MKKIIIGIGILHIVLSVLSMFLFKNEVFYQAICGGMLLLIGIMSLIISLKIKNKIIREISLCNILWSITCILFFGLRGDLIYLGIGIYFLVQSKKI